MTADRAVDVVIAGAGIVGLATAVAFRAAAPELSILVLEPRPAGAPDPRALALVAGSRRLLQALGAWPAIAGEAEPMRAIALADGRVDDLARPYLLGFAGEVEPGEPFAHVTPAQAIVDALAARAAALAVPRQAGRVIARQASGGAVRLELDDGRRLAAALLIAADGADSPLRRLGKIQVYRWRYGQRALTATLRHSRPHEGRATQHFLPGGPFALLPMTENRSAVVWSERAEAARRIAALPDAAFLAEVERRAGHELGDLALAGPRGMFPLRAMIARQFTAERLALVGDAARVLHPIAGQGVNLGLRDAAALVECCLDAARLGLDIGGAEALARYESWRRFDSAAFLAATDGLNRLFRLDAAPVRAIRDAGLALVDRSARAKASIMRTAAGASGEAPRLTRGALP